MPQNETGVKYRGHFFCRHHSAPQKPRKIQVRACGKGKKMVAVPRGSGYRHRDIIQDCVMPLSELVERPRTRGTC